MSNINFVPGTLVAVGEGKGVVTATADTGVVWVRFPWPKSSSCVPESSTTFLREPEYWSGERDVAFGDIVSDGPGNLFIYVGEDAMHKVVPLGHDDPESMQLLFPASKEPKEPAKEIEDDSIRLGTSVSLFGTNPPADGFFMVASEKIDEDGSYLLAYERKGKALCHRAKLEDMRFERGPYTWVRSAQPGIGAVGYYDGVRYILTGAAVNEDDTRVIRYNAVNVESGQRLTLDGDEFQHPDEFNGLLPMGQRVLVRGREDVCYIVRHNGGDQYSVALPPPDGETFVIINAPAANMVPLTPSFTLGSGFGTVHTFHTANVMVVGESRREEYGAYSVRWVTPVIGESGKVVDVDSSHVRGW